MDLFVDGPCEFLKNVLLILSIIELRSYTIFLSLGFFNVFCLVLLSFFRVQNPPSSGLQTYGQGVNDTLNSVHRNGETRDPNGLDFLLDY